MPRDPEMPDESQSQVADAFLALIAHNEYARRRSARTSRRLREAAASVVILALLGALGVEILAFKRMDREPEHAVAPTPAPTKTPRARETPIPAAPPSIAAAASSAAPAKPKPLELMMTATRGASWVEARENTAGGEVLYSGIVKQGTSLTVAATRIWVRFGSVGNLDLRLNGKSVRATHSGTIDAVVTPTGLHG